MASKSALRPPAFKSVFINCPFDDGFRPIFRAIVFTILSSGYFPRCALDSTDSADIRVSKIAAMIGECDWGIHDLSRVEVDVAGIPRFNMPMELGVHLGARLLGSGRHRRKRALILEAKQHRYDAVLSDISGQDIEVHHNDPDQAIRCVRNWLSDTGRSVHLRCEGLPRCRSTIDCFKTRLMSSSPRGISIHSTR